MDRRRFITDSVLGVASASAALVSTGKSIKASLGEEASETAPMYKKTGPTLFPLDVPSKQWAQFTAEGFSEPACGLIYRGSRPAEGGLPLGVIDTGGLDLGTDGTFGYCSMFGEFAPPRGPLRLPFFGIRVGKQIWVLATRYTEQIEGVEKASEIHYWGHYPVADLEYESSAPVSVGLRAWTPFIPGDIAMSNTPGAVFEVRLRNQTATGQHGSLLFSFPGPTQAEAQISPHSSQYRVWYNGMSALEPVEEGVVAARRKNLSGELNGVSVTSDAGIGYTLAALGGEKVHVGAQFGARGDDWIFPAPPPHVNEFGTSLTVDFDLGPGAEKTVRFVLAWYAPIWRGEGTHSFTHMYATRYPDSVAVAQLLAREHGSLLKRILRWQQAIYTHEKLPVWLREALVNNLYLINGIGLWAVAKPPIGNWCRKEDGLYGMLESPRVSCQIECIPCSFYGNMPLVYFYPELALSTLRGYKGYQFPGGAAPWIFGGLDEMATPVRGYQTTSNGISYAAMVDRYWLCTGNDGILKEFYPSVKQNTIYTMNLNPGPEGVISMPKGDIDPANGRRAQEWVEGEVFYGMTSHVGGLHLAELKIVERMAEKVGDREFAEQCRKWFQQGSEAMESKMWAGEYYLAYYEPETSKRSDRIFSCQLDGDWISKFDGLPPVFRPDRAKTTLKTIREKNSRLAPYGTPFFANPEGTAWQGAGYGPYTCFVSEQLMLAMTYIYAGEADFGLEQARCCLYNLVQKGQIWEQPCIYNPKTGERKSGFDYGQNMMLWSLPAVLENADLRGPCAPGGLVDQVIKAGRPT